jgi:hypothetical protein
MPAITRHTGRVTAERKLEFRNLDLWRETLARLAGLEVEVTIRRPAVRTSHSTHGYYRAEVLPFLAEEWGWGDPDELHFHLKCKHLPGIIPIEDPRWRVRRFGAETRVEPPSMADMSQDESGRFLDCVLRQAMDAGTPVPPPRGRRDAA